MVSQDAATNNVLAGSRSMHNYQKTLEIGDKSKVTHLL